MKKIIMTMVMLTIQTAAMMAVVADYRVVPLPMEIQAKAEKPFVLNEACVIASQWNDEGMVRNAQFLRDYLREATGINLTISTSKVKKQPAIHLLLNAKIAGQEAYRMTVDSKGITIEGSTPAGVFYGIQTLRKSLPIGTFTEVECPAVVINDQPRFGYRGMHMDVCRHFFPVEVVKEYIDILALHNMNILHWHLTDDQGWRIDIKKYPKLAQISSWRNRTVIGRNMDIYDNVPHGGYYTQEQLRDIVEYARQRYITIIPEIDMPGHMLAVLAAYPELGCTGGPYEVCPDWGVFPDILCAGNDNVYTFLRNVLDELIDIFPSEYIHIGGDEAPRTRWKECPKCQARIKALGLKGDGKFSAEAKLQGWFTSEIEKYLISKGRHIIGWDEILEGDVDKSATIMSWRGMAGGLEASDKGHDVIMTPNNYAYLDYYQTKESEWSKPLLIGGYVPLEKTYSLEPVPDSLSAAAKEHIIGVQANLWTEYIPYKTLLEYQMLPRAAAMSEVQWTTSAQKDYSDFLSRERNMLLIYDQKGYTYCKEAFKPKKKE